MEPDVTVSREIAASPEAVFAAITDITRMGEWSPENTSCAWKEGCDSPVVGAVWDGGNTFGVREGRESIRRHFQGAAARVSIAVSVPG